MKRKNIIKTAVITGYFIFLILSYIFQNKPGIAIKDNFIIFSLSMIKILPCAFILIGLFEVWVRKETIEKHLGKKSGIMGCVWAVLLAGTTVGPMITAFPVAHALYTKGAAIRIILIYLGASAICRIPMTIFEASFLGLKFSIIRLLVSIPLVILSSIWFSNYLEKRNRERKIV